VIEDPIIIGCGTIGAVLAFELAKLQLVSKLELYDFDRVNNNQSYPFFKYEAGIHKTQIVDFVCRCLNPSLEVVIHDQKVVEPLETDSFIIDCRDYKDNNINADITISLDGYMLYINSLQAPSNPDYHQYIAVRDESFIHTAIDHIVDYLLKGFYAYGDFRFYDLRNGDMHILERRVFCDSTDRSSYF